MSNIPTEDTIVKMDGVEEEEWIRAIKSLLFRNSEEGLIPEVTVSDNGKVLTVVKGAWDKADAPSGGSGEQVMVIPFMREYDGQQDIYSTQVTYADIESMYTRYLEGTPCMVSVTNPSSNMQDVTFVNRIIYSSSQSPADPTPSYTLNCTGMSSLNPDNVMYIRQDITFRGDGAVSVFVEAGNISVTMSGSGLK